MEWWLILLFSFGVLVFLMLIGIPIAYSLGFLSLILGLSLVGSKILYLFGTLAYGKINNFGLVAVPLFIFMAELILVSGAAEDSFDMLHKWVGFLPGGLGVASQFACALFAAVCGASTATTAVIGSMAVPEMMGHGYDKRLATGSIAAGGALGVLIPPSILLIIYGIIAEVSIGKLFIAGIIPGLILAMERVLYFLIRCIHNPSLGPPSKGITWKDRFSSAWKILPLMLLALFMFFALYSGITTPTEVAAIGVLASFIICMSYGKLKWKALKLSFLKTAQTTTFIFWILVAAASFGFVLSYLNVPQDFVSWVVSLKLNKYVIIVFINFVLFFLGCIMDPAAIIMITVPIFAPLMEMLGVNLVWFGIMFVVNIELAEITPPLGLNLYIMKSVAPPEVSLNDIIIGAIPFMILDILGLAIIIIWPFLVLWLPSMMK